MHCICLTDVEGHAILSTFQQFGIDYDVLQENRSIDFIEVNCKYIWDKNTLNRKHSFSSESDLEAYIVLSLKNNESQEYKSLNRLLDKYQNNYLQSSKIYNQFIFGNAYPSDIVILNDDNVNVLELKKDKLTINTIPPIEKEIRKHLYYSMSSNRLKKYKVRRFNFYLIYLKDSGNNKIKQLINAKYNDLCQRIIFSSRENTITFVEYTAKDNTLFLEEV